MSEPFWHDGYIKPLINFVTSHIDAMASGSPKSLKSQTSDKTISNHELQKEISQTM